MAETARFVSVPDAHTDNLTGYSMVPADISIGVSRKGDTWVWTTPENADVTFGLSDQQRWEQWAAANGLPPKAWPQVLQQMVDHYFIREQEHTRRVLARKDQQEWRERLAAEVKRFTDNPGLLDEVSPGYWTVPGGGAVLGNGPTWQTQYKAIRPDNAGVDPVAAPGTYAASLAEAAALLTVGPEPEGT